MATAGGGIDVVSLASKLRNPERANNKCSKQKQRRRFRRRTHLARRRDIDNGEIYMADFFVAGISINANPITMHAEAPWDLRMSL